MDQTYKEFSKYLQLKFSILKMDQTYKEFSKYLQFSDY